MTLGRLGGKVAIITGASTGLGPVMASHVRAAKGRGCCSTARREELVQQAAPAAGRGAIAMRADVTNEDDVAAMVSRAVDEFGQVDIMCNNAAAPGTGSVDLGADARELERHHRHRRHRRDALHPRGAEPVDAGDVVPG